MVSETGQEKEMIVAIDGPAGCGKSTVSEQVADTLGFIYINSGNFYRAITFAHIESGKDQVDAKEIVETARNMDLAIAEGKLQLSGRNIEDKLHTDSVDALVAQHSALVEIRHMVNDLIRSLTAGLNAVIEGRDIGTVVFPDAHLKVFLDASPDVRALRRYRQGMSEKTLEELADNIRMRDQIDRNKKEGSLKRAEGAFYLDTSYLTIEEVCEKVVRKFHDHRSN
jgi:cytidylate kinase